MEVIEPVTGRQVAVVHLPTTNVSSVAFGGPSLDQLYITTARRGLNPATLSAEPHAGDIFVVEPAVTGPRQTVSPPPKAQPSLGSVQYGGNDFGSATTRCSPVQRVFHRSSWACRCRRRWPWHVPAHTRRCGRGLPGPPLPDPLARRQHHRRRR